MIKKSPIISVFFVAFSSLFFGQNHQSAELKEIILKQDSLLFSEGFNKCKIEYFENLLSKDLKFYHDKDGISDKEKFLKDLKSGLCKNPDLRQVKRVLVQEHNEVFPLYKNGVLYGAIHNGVHMFYESSESQPGIAKFSNVWILEKNKWKLNTSLSFDHQAYSESQ